MSSKYDELESKYWTKKQSVTLEEAKEDIDWLLKNMDRIKYDLYKSYHDLEDGKTVKAYNKIKDIITEVFPSPYLV